MGYKLAGYDVIGNCEIDPHMMKLYQRNHQPAYSFLMPIQEFNQIPDEDLPNECFQLDILDGSPPCSVFSLAGQREKKWGSEHHFREGQAKQQLDDLFFHFLDTVEKLRPKVVVAENVKGMLAGNARGYVKLLKDRFEELGYRLQLFLLNAATMGVPQKRERVFFIAREDSLSLPDLTLSFQEPPIPYGVIRSGHGRELKKDSLTYQRWLKRRPRDTRFADILQREEGKNSLFTNILVHQHRVMNTITSSGDFIRYDEPFAISDLDIIRAQTFPYDYDFMKSSVQYVCGMSVPPVMMKKIAQQIDIQWFQVLHHS